MMSQRELDDIAGLNDQSLFRQKPLSSVQSTLMSRSLPAFNSTAVSTRQGGLHSSQSLSGRASLLTYRNKQYPSATAALTDYIANYDNKKPGHSIPYRRTVSDLLLPKTTLQKTVQRSLETGIRDTKNEFHRFNIRKLIDDSYDTILRADLEHEKASTLPTSTDFMRTSSPLPYEIPPMHEKDFTDIASEISSSTDALLLANPYQVPVFKVNTSINHFKSRQSSQVNPTFMHSGQKTKGMSHLMRISSRHSKSSSRERSHSQPSTNPLKGLYVLNRPYRSDALRGRQSSQRGSYSSRRLSGSHYRAGRRPIPAWVSNLDSSVTTQKNLATLYTDTLLSADGHTSLQETLGAGLSDANYMRGSDISTDSLLDNSAATSDLVSERSMSVMSGRRPPPTWVEELDTTSSHLPASLRILAVGLDSNQSGKGDLSHSSGRFPHKNSRSGILSDNVKPQSTSQSGHVQLKGGTMTTNGSVKKVIYKKGHHSFTDNLDGKHKRAVHMRTQSASTEELINESPCGNGVSTLRQSAPKAPYRDFNIKQSMRKAYSKSYSTSKGNNSHHSSLKQRHHMKVLPKSTSHHHQRQHHHRGALLDESSSHSHHQNNGIATAEQQLDNTTTTDSLIYSSPFGLDKDIARARLSMPSTSPGLQEGHIPPRVNDTSNGTLQEDDLATLSPLSSITLHDEREDGGEKQGSHVMADYFSESTVGESARADAMLRRAERIIRNTQSSLNTSSLLDQEGHSSDSGKTSELLAGDQEFFSKQARLQTDLVNAADTETPRILDKFLDDCVHSSEEKIPETATVLSSEGPLESLKNMLFQLQDMASQHTQESSEETNQQPPKQYSSVENGQSATRKVASKIPVRSGSLTRKSSSHLTAAGPTSNFAMATGSSSPEQPAASRSTVSPSQRSFDEEPGGRSILKAMTHLSRLKMLVAVDTSSSVSRTQGVEPQLSSGTQ
ncbi:uncharacterized protein [Diadema setosum]|uniref:uncharacterized protein n=1 Tax=Diadema setosum TaxID=31175 RepID=UPI003B3B5822